MIKTSSIGQSDIYYMNVKANSFSFEVEGDNEKFECSMYTLELRYRRDELNNSVSFEGEDPDKYLDELYAHALRFAEEYQLLDTDEKSIETFRRLEDKKISVQKKTTKSITHRYDFLGVTHQPLFCTEFQISSPNKIVITKYIELLARNLGISDDNVFLLHEKYNPAFKNLSIQPQIINDNIASKAASILPSFNQLISNISNQGVLTNNIPPDVNNTNRLPSISSILNEAAMQDFSIRKYKL